MSEADLNKQLSELKLELAKEKAQIAVGAAAKNPGRIRTVKKTIAKMLTRLSAKKKKEVVKTG